MSVNRYWMPIIVIVALLGSVFVAQIFGWWSVSGRTAVDAGELTPEGLKGWMTLQQVADGLGVSVEDVYRLGGYPEDTDPNTALKDMEDIAEVSDLREAMAEYLATGEIPGEPEPTTEPVPTGEPENTPEATVVPEATATTEAEHTGGAGGAGTGEGAGPTPLPEGEILPAEQIKGRMTLREVSDQCAVDLDELLAALNLPADVDRDTSLRTLVGDGVLSEVSQVKDAAASLQ